MELLHSNIWWLDGVELLNKGFTHAKCRSLYHKSTKCVDDIWVNEQTNFHTKDKIRKKINLTPVEMDDWTEIVYKSS